MCGDKCPHAAQLVHVASCSRGKHSRLLRCFLEIGLHTVYWVRYYALLLVQLSRAGLVLGHLGVVQLTIDVVRKQGHTHGRLAPGVSGDSSVSTVGWAGIASVFYENRPWLAFESRRYYAIRSQTWCSCLHLYHLRLGHDSLLGMGLFGIFKLYIEPVFLRLLNYLLVRTRWIFVDALC